MFGAIFGAIFGKKNVQQAVDAEASPLLSKEYLQSIDPDSIAMESVRDGLENAEKRLRDLLDAKKLFEDMAMNFLKFQTTMVSIIAPIIIVVVNKKIVTPDLFTSVLVLLSVGFLIGGALCSLFCLKVATYGTLGGHPKNWLQKSIIRDEKNLKTLSLLSLHSYVKRIDESEESNAKKASRLQKSIWLIIMAVVSLGVSLLTLFYQAFLVWLKALLL